MCGSIKKLHFLKKLKNSVKYNAPIKKALSYKTIFAFDPPLHSRGDLVATWFDATISLVLKKYVF